MSLIEERLGTNYEILSLIGRGGMSDAYLARHRSLGRLCVIKELTSLSEDSAAAVISEARTIAKVAHPMVVQVYDVIQIEQEAYIVEEYVQGVGLDRILKQAASKQQSRAGCSLSADVFAKIIGGVTEAARACHKSGIVHRDIKPSNIMIDAEMRPKLIDFGVAREMSQVEVSNATVASGTLAYMPPESFGDSYKAGPETDIYAIGCVAYELVTRNAPYSEMPVGQMLIKKGSGPLSFDKPAEEWILPFTETLSSLTAVDPAERLTSLDSVTSTLKAMESRGRVDQDDCFSNLVATELEELKQKAKELQERASSEPKGIQLAPALANTMPRTTESDPAETRTDYAQQSLQRRSNAGRVVKNLLKIAGVVVGILIVLLIAGSIVANAVERREAREEEREAREEERARAELERMSLSVIQGVWNVAAYRINGQYIPRAGSILSRYGSRSLNAARAEWRYRERLTLTFSNDGVETFESLAKQYEFTNDNELIIRSDVNRNGTFESNEILRFGYEYRDDWDGRLPNESVIVLSDGTGYLAQFTAIENLQRTYRQLHLYYSDGSDQNKYEYFMFK